MAKVSFKQQVLRTREEAIVTAANRLLAEKGYDLMTVDEVAAEVGIAKASLYKHFASKEALAAAAMVRVLERALVFATELDQSNDERVLTPLISIVKWSLQMQLGGEMPSLPAQNSALRGFLMSHAPYRDRLVALSERLGAWIEAAQAAGALHPDLPAEVVLYTLFAKACDPVVGVLKASANFTDEQIVEMLLRTCFDGLAAGAHTF